MTPFPAPNRLHVWWARRPLVAARAAVLASLLPADADHERFLHVLGIHGDPVAAKQRIAKATREGVRLGKDAYGYSRAFQYTPCERDAFWLLEELQKLGITIPSVLDPTAGGGAIPFEGLRLGCAIYANDINPVAVLVEKATFEWPAQFGSSLRDEVEQLGKELALGVRKRLAWAFPPEPGADCRPDGYLWARTITCPYCGGTVPLSPNWRLAPDGTGVQLAPHLGDGPGDSSQRRCSFLIVKSAHQQSPGTVKGGSATCPYPDCGRVIEGKQVKEQAQAGGMGEQLFAVVFKRQVAAGHTKAGKPKRAKWERGYRSPRPEDDNSAAIGKALEQKLPEWEALNMIPSEQIPDGHKTLEPQRYGMHFWRDLFSPRQLLCHGASVEIFQEMFTADQKNGKLSEIRRAAYGYLSLSLDKLLNYNSRMTRWHSKREVVLGAFDRHDFSFKWSYGEMAPLVVGLGYDWAIKQTAKCIDELVSLISPATDTPNGKSKDKLPFPENTSAQNSDEHTPANPPAAPSDTITITCKPGDRLDHIRNNTIDVIVMDPPYYDNVMYAELSDFFYVWLKRTAGLLEPELFMAPLTDKENEAVANPALHQGRKGAKAVAGLDYQKKMAAMFKECVRVLKQDGLMTLMFTHKATGAWDALTQGLIDAGFVITASWPINTEAEGSLHIKDKSAANSTILLVCRPRPARNPADGVQYWEDLEPRVKRAVRKRLDQFQQAGIRGVDLYLSCFGPALEELSSHWPIQRGQPKPCPHTKRSNGAAQNKPPTICRPRLIPMASPRKTPWTPPAAR